MTHLFGGASAGSSAAAKEGANVVMRPVAVVFDLYGTLLGIDSLAGAARAAGVSDPEGFVESWRRKQIEYAWCASLMDDYRDFDTLTAKALEFTCEATGVHLGATGRQALADEWLRLTPYSDVISTLRLLQERGIRLAVLTNGVKSSALTALSAAGVLPFIDAVLSVNDVRAYKPDPRVYLLPTRHFGCDASKLMFVSSNGWDATGAVSAGYQVIWCNRTQRPRETFGHPPNVTLAGLRDLASVLV